MGFEGRGQSGPYIWQDFNSIICDLEKLLRLKNTLYCFSFAVCLISYIKLLDYGSTGFYPNVPGERGRDSLLVEIQLRETKYSEFYSYVFKLNYGLASKLLGTLRYTTAGCSVSSANLKQIKISLYSYRVFSIYVTLQKWIPSYVRLCSTFIQQRLDQ